MELLPYKHFSKIYTSLLLFVLVLLSGVVGYMLIEHYTFLEALYMTVITLSTVGFAEVRHLSDAGRIFTIAIILVNLSAFTYFIALISSYFLDGEFTKAYKQYKMKKSISELENHIIICGFGRNGHEAARVFQESGKEFVVIEKMNPSHDGPPSHIDFYLKEDATRDEVLLEAGIQKAYAVVSTLPDDADNLFVVLTARALNPKLKIVSRASHDTTVKKLKTAGADSVIMPDKIGGVHMATLVLSPDIKEFVDLITTQNNEQFAIHEVESAKTMSLEELDCWRKTGATILGIKTSDRDYMLNPALKTQIQPGNKLIAMGSKEQMKSLEMLVK